MLIPDPVALGAVVRKRRSALGMSQTQLATKVGTTRQWLSRFEQGTNDVSIAIVFAILGALDLELQIPDPVGSEPSTQETGVPASAVPTAPVAPIANPETETDRFALLRSRDALAGLRMPGWVPSAKSLVQQDTAVIGDAAVVGDTAIVSDNVQSNHAESVDDAQSAKADREHRVIPMPVRPGPKASHRMDQDIARIKKSSIFKR